MEQLASAVEHMRTQLEGKAYVERYVHTLTHELKSPLAAIRGAAELLHGEMPQVQRERFVGNIESESARMQQLIERLLNLALVEQRQVLEDQVEVPDLSLFGERFLLRQAIGNLLDNALDFTPSGGVIRFSAERDGEQLQDRKSVGSCTAVSC